MTEAAQRAYPLASQNLTSLTALHLKVAASSFRFVSAAHLALANCKPTNSSPHSTPAAPVAPALMPHSAPPTHHSATSPAH